MKKHPALAVVEFSDIPTGITATDAMLKKAPIAWLRCGTITSGRYLTMIGGTTASVEESFQAGLLSGDGSLVDSVLLPDVHPQLFAATLGERHTGGRGALAIIETPTVSAIVRAAEAALKGTPVTLVEIRLGDSGLAGKGVSVYQGALHDIEAAVQLAEAVVRESGQAASVRIIPAPAEAMTVAVEGGTSFASANLFELEGEKG